MIGNLSLYGTFIVKICMLKEKIIGIDCEKEVNLITSFIQRIVEEAGAKGVLVGLSGGVDSSLVVALCVKALGNDKVIGLIMPEDFTPKKDIQDAEELAGSLRIKLIYAPINTIVSTFIKSLNIDTKEPYQKVPLANLRARVRMCILYYYANLYNYLVAGTGDKSEDLIGYFTKYGDGGVDFLPIAHLYKTQVRMLAEYLGVPKSIAYKPSSPQLYPGHKATDEIPLDYEQLDPVLYALFDLKLSPEEVSKLTNTSLSLIEGILRLHENSEHKRRYPKMLKEW